MNIPKLKKAVLKAANFVLDLFFPPKCPFCKSIVNGAPVCGKCMESISFCTGKKCIVCGMPIDEFAYDICGECNRRKTYFTKCFVPLRYEEDVKHTILEFKYYSHPYHAKGLSYLMAQTVLKDLPNGDYPDFLTYIPQNKKTRRKRGYNQSKLLAKYIGEYMNLPVIDTLKRTNDGENQAKLNARRRAQNVKKCYFKKDKKLCGTVLLIDDVYTTGSTSNYCSRLLLEMGCEKVYVCTAAINCQ